MNHCGNCNYLVDVFGNFVQCIKTGKFVDYEYWNNIEVEDCPYAAEKQAIEKVREQYEAF